jgi:hypothetical protein
MAISLAFGSLNRAVAYLLLELLAAARLSAFRSAFSSALALLSLAEFVPRIVGWARCQTKASLKLGHPSTK